MSINKEDYQEPRCVLCMDDPNKPKITPVDMSRITSKLDDYLDHEDFSGAERHLAYWLQEAKLGNDLKGQFSIQNEIMGLKRKLGKEDEAFAAADAAISLGAELKNQDTIGGATAFLNYGTVCEAFGKPEKAVEMYKKAQIVYEKYLKNDSPKLGGLYNNMAMALSLSGKYQEATEYFYKAIDVMGRVQFGEIEQAITYLNLADTYSAEQNEAERAEEIEGCLDKAQALLDSPRLPRSGYYAYMADKCIESFRYYGYFFYADELEKRVRSIYDEIKENDRT